MNSAYVYRWTHIPTYKWYIGSRTALKAHPDDGYICSSLIVKPMIEANPQEWRRDILFVGSPSDAYDYESMLLDLFDARNDDRSFNQHNNNGIYKVRSPNKGKSPSAKTRQKLSVAGKNRRLTPEHKAKISAAHKGKVRTPEHQAKLTASYKGRPKKQRIVSCVHCGYTSTASTITRLHNDNCKHKDQIWQQ